LMETGKFGGKHCKQAMDADYLRLYPYSDLAHLR